MWVDVRIETYFKTDIDDKSIFLNQRRSSHPTRERRCRQIFLGMARRKKCHPMTIQRMYWTARIWRNLTKAVDMFHWLPDHIPQSKHRVRSHLDHHRPSRDRLDVWKLVRGWHMAAVFATDHSSPRKKPSSVSTDTIDSDWSIYLQTTPMESDGLCAGAGLKMSREDYLVGLEEAPAKGQTLN